MPLILRIFLFIAIFIYFLWMYRLLKSKKLDLKYSMMWLFSGIILLIIIIFIDEFEAILHLMGVAEGMNGLFAIAIFLILLMLMVITSAVSQFGSKLKTLVQKCALMEERIRKLEKEIEVYKKGENDNSMFN